MELTIGQVSELLGLSTEAIRFYEQQNIVLPRRKEHSKYRYYDAWNMFDLFECLSYRNMNFSLKEINRVMKKEGLDFLKKQVDLKCIEIEQNLLKSQLLLNCMEEFKERLETAIYNVGKYWIKKTPELQCILITRRNLSKYENIDCEDEV
ncbi:MerR family transcriptional regulator [Alkalibacter mobilis]|uniref:MerR family transcriptional regulator n=1 Tax=Alkalibacter mobilis TaxID=2787712 RepID=UPI00189CB375|nr:MerR family transcriptional regulator [Alkalibacter mobilis]MBF7097773.1 MerR family transcriptional regulator [Alkalibacter mobilis]